MLVRVWSTGIVKGKEKEYEKFTHEFSVPMFQKQKGLLGVTVLMRNNRSHVLTYWNRREDMLNMESNALYKETVEKINDREFLVPPQKVNFFHAPIHYSKVNIDSSEVYLF